MKNSDLQKNSWLSFCMFVSIINVLHNTKYLIYENFSSFIKMILK